MSLYWLYQPTLGRRYRSLLLRDPHFETTYGLFVLAHAAEASSSALSSRNSISKTNLGQLLNGLEGMTKIKQPTWSIGSNA